MLLPEILIGIVIGFIWYRWRTTNKERIYADQRIAELKEKIEVFEKQEELDQFSAYDAVTIEDGKIIRTLIAPKKKKKTSLKMKGINSADWFCADGERK